MRRTFLLTSLLVFGCLLILMLGSASSDGPAKPYNPPVLPASEEGLKAIKRIRVPKGMEATLFAAEPMLANPVCFCIDEKGQFYVGETFRHSDGVTDNRGHKYWLEDDLAARTVADRVAMYKKHLKGKADSYGVQHDRVRMIVDADGDGKADRATVFADGFNNLADGIGAGLLARKGDVYFTCIPDLWLLRDTKGQGEADVRKSLSTGYGVHVAFIGHDLHGLRIGPDGKLYFSIGDRGFNVPQLKEQRREYPDTGAVLRCNLDGSDLEVVAYGLRNPQELAFDQYGNLFTGDNNSDGGDRARWVQIVEGGDSGWRIGYQYMEDPYKRGPWNDEKMWHPQNDAQPAYIVPPIINVADGPSGLTYYPGVGLPERYNGHFFLADFRGQFGNSGIRSFAVKPKGASFELVDQHEFIWSVLATDVDFGPDCAMYVSDWVDGWDKPRKGRIYRVASPDLAKDPQALEVKKLLGEGFDLRPVGELKKLLEHADMRVRQEAQFALTAKGLDGITTFSDVVRDGQPLARLHALWGLGMMARSHGGEVAKIIPPLLKDADPEVRAQASKVLGDIRASGAVGDMLPLLKDAEPRVRMYAAIAIGKARGGRKSPETFAAVLDMLRDNADKDVYLRHAGVMALAGVADDASLKKATGDASASVRLAALLAYRRLEKEDAALFLDDADPRLVLEAARAINDVPLPSGFAKLAGLITRTKLDSPLGHRVLNAHFRLGQPENARALAVFAGRSDVQDSLRVEAVKMLGDWAKPSGRDRVVGLWRPLAERPAEAAAEAVRTHLGGLFSGSDMLRQEAVKLTAKYGIKEVGPVLFDMVGDAKRSPVSRVEALRALDVLKNARLEQAMNKALDDGDARVRTEGRRVLAKRQPSRALTVLKEALDKGSIADQQGALGVLAEMPGDASDALLGVWMDKLLAKTVPAEVQLDLLEAAGKRKAADLTKKLTTFEAARSKDDHLAAYRESLAGGDAENGKYIFLSKAEVSCLRCHKAQGMGVGEVGPDLTGIATKQNREYLLEALVAPNKQIAKGFETVVVTLLSGKTETGIVKAEDAKEVQLLTAEGKLLTVPKSQIDERTAGKSAMPEDLLKHLSKREIRDLVEFLSGLN